MGSQLNNNVSKGRSVYQTVSKNVAHRSPRARFVAVDGLFLYVGAQTVLRLMMTILPFFVGSICLPTRVLCCVLTIIHTMY